MGLHPTMNLPGHLSQQGHDPAWYGQQGAGSYPSMTPLGPHGQQGQAPSPGLLGGGQTPTTMPLGQQGQPPAPRPPGMVQNSTNATAAPQALAAQQGGAQTAVQPPGGTNVGGMPQNLTGRAAHVTNLQDYSGISRALERLAPIMTDADTSRNLRWQHAKIATWKIEATSSPGLQFYACMQPGKAFMVLGHSMSTIYSTTTDISTLHGEIVLFPGDRKGTHECVPIIFLPPQSAFEWKKCSVIEDKEALIAWYGDNPDKYGDLWEPTINDGTRGKLQVPRMIALPLRTASLFHQFKGPVMPHELLNAIELHLSSPDTTLNNGGEWGLVQKWLIEASQKDGGGGDPTKSKLHVAFCTDALLSNDDHIHRWIADKLDSTLGICISHGAMRKHCSHEGCANGVVRGGVCISHGAKKTRCKHEACTNGARKGGVCASHGAKPNHCSHEGCTNQAVMGGVCVTHGEKVKCCSHEGCIKLSKKRGLCRRHGTKSLATSPGEARLPT